MKYSPYSFSKLSTYNHCPRKFKYNYIDKAPKDKSDITALLKGGAIHSIIEHYPEETTHKLAPQYQHIVDSFVVTGLGQKYLGQKSIREFDFGLTKDLIPTSYSDKEALFRGSVDYICTIDDVLHLIDWKSGKSKDPRWQVYDQLMFYAIYFFKAYENINKIRITYVYVEHDEYENDIVLERQYLNNYVNDLTNNIEKVEADEIFVKNEGKLCAWCDFRTYCSTDI